MLFNAEMEFEGFKFKPNKKYEENFSEALIESPLQFIRLSKESFDEKMHIAFSWMAILNISALGLMGIAIIIALLQAPIIGIISICISMISRIGSKKFQIKLEDLSISKSFCIGMYEMNNYENLEIVRQELIEEKRNSTKPSNN